MFAFCCSSFNFNTSFLIVLAAASDSRTRFIARDQSDLLFDHISHVVTSGFFLSETTLKIKYNFRNNLSCLIWEQLYEGKIQDRGTDVQSVESNNSKVSMLITNFSVSKIMAPIRYDFRGRISTELPIIYYSSNHNRYGFNLVPRSLVDEAEGEI